MCNEVESSRSIYLHPIAEVFLLVNEKHSKTNSCCGAVEVVSLYPHNVNCTEQETDYLQKTKIDPSVHGQRWEIYPFPCSEVVFGDAFKPFLNRMAKWRASDSNIKKCFHRTN